MIQYSKRALRLGDIVFAQNPNFLKSLKDKGYKFIGVVSSELPKNEVVMVKSNKNNQIEDISPREVGKIDLYSKYYHRDARIYVDKYFTEVCHLLHQQQNQ